MIPPVLIIVRTRRATIPVPAVLLWPLLLAALVVAQLVLPFVPIEGTTPAQRALTPLMLARALGAAHGLRVEVRSHNGNGFYIRVI
jgi:hypothetical protein